jgi:hypothetical protein
MGNLECYEAKLGEITAIADADIIVPSIIPIDIYLQEADNLFVWCQDDKERLILAKLDWRIAEDLPIRAGALREAVARWAAIRRSKRDAPNPLKEKAAEYADMRNELLHNFYFAYRRNSRIIDCINSITVSASHARLVQNLNDLSSLGKNNPDELLAIDFDMNLLDVATSMACESPGVFASIEVEKGAHPAKKIRDQAYTLLKLAVDEVCQALRIRRTFTIIHRLIIAHIFSVSNRFLYCSIRPRMA